MSMTDAERIQALVQGYLSAYTAHDAEGCAALYNEDAVLLSPWEAPVHGPEAIARTHEAWFAEGETNKMFEIADLVVGSDLAVCLLHFRANVPGADGRLDTVEGTSLNTLRRQPDGGWRMLHTSLNMLNEPARETGG